MGGILAAGTAGGWVARTLVVSPLAAPAIAGTIGFVVVWLLVSSMADVAVAWDRGRVELGGRSLFDRGMGGFFGFYPQDSGAYAGHPYPRPEQLRTHHTFWHRHNRLRLGMQPADHLAAG